MIGAATLAALAAFLPASDFDKDGRVGGDDIAHLFAHWQTPGADLTGDGVTNGEDLAVLLASWGVYAVRASDEVHDGRWYASESGEPLQRHPAGSPYAGHERWCEGLRLEPVWNFVDEATWEAEQIWAGATPHVWTFDAAIDVRVATRTGGAS